MASLELARLFFWGIYMKVVKRNIKTHLFICTNVKENKECCGIKDASSLIKEIKIELHNRDLWDEYKVTGSHCLGPCSEGISATLYPDNLLIKELSLSSKEELINLLLKD